MLVQNKALPKPPLGVKLIYFDKSNNGYLVTLAGEKVGQVVTCPDVQARAVAANKLLLDSTAARAAQHQSNIEQATKIGQPAPPPPLGKIQALNVVFGIKTPAPPTQKDTTRALANRGYRTTADAYTKGTLVGTLVGTSSKASAYPYPACALADPSFHVAQAIFDDVTRGAEPSGRFAWVQSSSNNKTVRNTSIATVPFG